ncbi:hypothetical protein SAMN04487980_102882 [Streptomyces sp. cf124]|uniref:hypothetical protein n=1 Tax=Streptomyces sp. cf124 TaxID=1761903 RepID=UPI0008E12226|nr:hypothetical protein [Streptomyces sp. cf124]SFN69181.1 hypothetical protein SAMN04487980_102882 [Streptomyces sp. cf124]
MTDSDDPYRRLRRTQYVLFLLMAALGTAGGITESLWLLGLAAWALIAAGLIEMIYRP